MLGLLIAIPYLIIALVHIYGERRNNLKIKYSTKPLLMPILIIMYIFTVNLTGINWLIVFALLFGMLGDIFLMLPERFFIPGLISFLFGHICYIVGFGMPIPTSGNEIAATLIAIILLFLAGWIYIRLAAGMQDLGKERMRIPVLFYTVVIVLMTFSALMTLFNDDWNVYSSILVSIGAILFLVSDIMNAWVRFVTIIPNHRLWIMSTYHLAQMGIAIGAVLHISDSIPFPIMG